MWEINELEKLIEIMNRSSLEELEIEQAGAKLAMKKRSAQAAPPAAIVAAPLPAPPAAIDTPQPSATQPSGTVITAPMVGTFYAAPEPGKAPFVKTGDRVKPGQLLCILEAMKLFNEIDAEKPGVILEVLVKDGQMVEFGQPLFVIAEE